MVPREFKKALRLVFGYCPEGWQEWRADYHESLYTAPVPDDIETAVQYLNWKKQDMDSYSLTNLTCKSINDYNNYADEDCLAPLPPVECPPPCPKASRFGFKKKADQQEEGKTPMRYNEASATIVQNVRADIAVQREYFLSRLENAQYPKSNDLQKTFNLYVDNTPKNFQQLIDAIKADKFKVTDKAKLKLAASEEEKDENFGYRGPLYGFVWEGPQADHKGYEAATTEMGKQLTSARDTIMSGDASAMAKAVADFEAWTPVGNAN